MLSSKTIKIINKEVTGDGIVLSVGMIDSCLSSYMYYEDITEQISSIFRGLIKNHAFVDGNKRTAVIVLFILVQELNMNIAINDSQLFNIIIKIAKGNFDVEDIATMLFGERK